MAKDNRRNIKVTDLINSLERAGCQFWACDGPDKRFVSMKTCVVCDLLRRLNRGQKVIDDRQRRKTNEKG